MTRVKGYRPCTVWSMAGKYHRTYLDHAKQEAFDKMQAETRVASNAYIAEAVRLRLVQDGYLEPRRNLREENEARMAAPKQEEELPVRRRRRALRR